MSISLPETRAFALPDLSAAAGVLEQEDDGAVHAPKRNPAGAAVSSGVCRWGTLAALLLAASAVLAARPAAFSERYSPVPAGPDGIRKRYKGRGSRP